MKTTTIHLMHGFIGFGKTTIAKKLAKEYSAVRLNYEDFSTIFGRNPINDGFGEYCKRIGEQIRILAEETIANGVNIIIDHGHWTKQERADKWQWAKQLTPNVIFHVVQCNMKTAKERAVTRTNNKENGTDVTETDFENCQKRFEPMQDDEAKNYKIVFHSN